MCLCLQHRFLSAVLWCATLFLFDNSKLHHTSLHSLLLLCAVSNRTYMEHTDVCLLLWQNILSWNVSRIILAWCSVICSSRKHEQTNDEEMNSMLHSHFVYVINARTIFDYLKMFYHQTKCERNSDYYSEYGGRHPLPFSFPYIVNLASAFTINLTCHLRVCVWLT